MSKMLDRFRYRRAVARGSPVDAPWSVAGQMITAFRQRKTHAPPDSPLSIHDVLDDPYYRDLMTADVERGDRAPDFELPLIGGTGTIRLSTLNADRPVALVFGSFT